MTSRYIQSIYCDDIRHEVSGKVSYIGVYAGEMIIPHFPATLPKLCVSTRIVTPICQPFESLTISVLQDERELQEFELTDETIEKAREDSAKAKTGVEQVQIFSWITAFSPFHLEGPCTIRVHAQTESEVVKAIALKVIQGEIPGNR